MKKIISLVLLTVFTLSLFSLSSCKTKTPDTPQAGNSESTENFGVDMPCTGDASFPKCRLVADKNEAAPGDTVNVAFRMSDAKAFCSVSATIGFDSSAVTFAKEKSYSDEDFLNIVNNTDKEVVYNGYVMTTVDFDSRELITATFKVNENAQPGSEAVFSVVLDELGLGLDPSGSETKSVEAAYSPIQISVKIK